MSSPHAQGVRLYAAVAPTAGLLCFLVLVLLLSLPATNAFGGIHQDGRIPPEPPEYGFYPEPPGVEPAVSTPPADLFRWPSERVEATTSVRPSAEPLLVILFKFKDTASSYPNHAQTTAAGWQSYAFGASSSLADYYDEVSYGGLTLTAAAETHGTQNDGIVGWYTSAKNWNQYLVGGSADRVAILRDAIAAADANVDFSTFDDDNDGFISSTELHILVVAAAYEESFYGAPSPKVWRSNWCLYDGPDVDNVEVGDCDGDGSMAIMGELDPSKRRVGIGLAAHEVGHQLGWMDFYDTDPSCSNRYVRTQGVGRWCLMASGDWLGDYSGNNDSLLAQSPAHPSAWNKAYRGWTIPVEVTEDATGVGILEAENHAVAYKLWSNGAYGDDNKEYFLVENRRQTGYDRALPGCGLVVYHVDEGVAALDYDFDQVTNWDDNDLEWDFDGEFIDVECADGYGRNANGSQCNQGCAHCAKDDLDVQVYQNQSGQDCNFNVYFDNRGDAGNPFPGTTVNTRFDSTTCPGSEDNNGNTTLVGIKNISSSCADTMYADLIVGNIAPYVPDVWLRDCATDVGSEPSGCASFWTSPDIWIDNDRDGTQDAPKNGQQNRFFVGVRNCGNAPAINVSVKLYYRSNSTGLAFPTGATLLGQAFVGLVPAGGSVRTEMVGVIPDPPQAGHWCFGATLDCSGDALNVNAGLTADNNKACVNIIVLAGRAGQPVQNEFLAETPDDGSNPGPGSYAMQLTHDLPAGWLALLEWKPTAGAPWEPYPVGLPFWLNGIPEDDREFRLTVLPPATPYQGQAGTVSVQQIFYGTGDPVGGIEFPIWQDNVPPMPITDLVAEVANEEPGQWPLTLAVRLGWTPPTQDTGGGLEIVHYHEVHRSTTAGFPPDPSTLVAISAADQDSATAGWQFTDRDTLLAAGVTYYYNVIAVDRAAWPSAPSNEASVTPLPLVDHADHDVGNCVLTMTDRGILGFMDDTQAEGSGFVFPAGGSSLLFVGSLWVGAGPTYIANRDYGLDPAKEWVVAGDPDGHVRVDSNGASDQDIHAGFTDDGATAPHGLHVRQESWAFADAPDDDFVIVRYFVENRSGGTMDDLYVGLFLDVDIATFTQNTGGTDASRRLAYVHGGAGNLHMGASYLRGDPTPDAMANLTLVLNTTYVHPQGHMLDADKWGFLTAAGPQYVLTEATLPEDYSLLVSAGPITLQPGEIDELAFAVLGGEGLAELLASADRAQEAYGPMTGLGDDRDAPALVTRLLPNAPNPFNPTTVIRFELAQPGIVELSVYDVQGRLVRKLFAGQQPSGPHALTWDARDDAGRTLSSGVFFLRFAAATRVEVQRIVLLK